MHAEDRVALMARQATLLEELFVRAARRAARSLLDPQFRLDLDAAPDEAARTRVLLDQVASLTDASAVALHRLGTG